MAVEDGPRAAPNQAAADDTVVAAQTARANLGNEGALNANGVDQMVPAQGQGAGQGAATDLGGGDLNTNGGHGGPPLQRRQGRAAPRQINPGALVAAPLVHANQGVVAGALAAAPPLPNLGDWDVEAALMGPAFRRTEAGEFFLPNQDRAPAAAPPLPTLGDWDVEAALAGPAFRRSEVGEFFFPNQDRVPAAAPPLPTLGDWDVEAALTGPAFRKSEVGEFFFPEQDHAANRFSSYH